MASPSWARKFSGGAALVRPDGAVMAVGGMALALGVLPRLAALGLTATIVGHAFWRETDTAVRRT